MTLREAIEKFKERVENSPRLQEIREALAKKMAEQKANCEDKEEVQ